MLLGDGDFHALALGKKNASLAGPGLGKYSPEILHGNGPGDSSVQRSLAGFGARRIMVSAASFDFVFFLVGLVPLGFSGKFLEIPKDAQGRMARVAFRWAGGAGVVFFRGIHRSGAAPGNLF